MAQQAVPVVWSPTTRAHDPKHEVWLGTTSDTTEVAARVDAILASLRAAGHQLVEAGPGPDEVLKAVHDPDLLPPMVLFALGLVLDALGGMPPGLSALALLLVRLALLGSRRLLLAQPFVVVWAGFALVVLGFGAVRWVLAGLWWWHLFALQPSLLEALFTGRAHLADSVEKHMGPGLPLVGAGEPVATARQELEKSDAVLVIEDGKPVGVLTRADLLSFLTA